MTDFICYDKWPGPVDVPAFPSDGVYLQLHTGDPSNSIPAHFIPEAGGTLVNTTPIHMSYEYIRGAAERGVVRFHVT